MAELFFVTLSLICAFSIAYALCWAGWIALPKAGQRIGSIDGLRGYLALAVMFHHFYIWLRVLNGAPWEVPPSNLFANFGQAGVVLFFMVTGALFYSKVSNGLQNVNWAALYISRVFRLMPLMAFAVLAIIIVIFTHSQAPLLIDWHHGAEPILRWIAFQGSPNIFGFDDTRRIVASVAWSLKQEWRFYLLLPAAAVIFRWTSNRLYTLTTLLSVFLVLHIIGFDEYISTIRFIPLFLLGMISVELSRCTRISTILQLPLVSLIGLGALAVETTLFPGAYALPQYFLLALFFAPVVSGNSYFGIFGASASIVLSELSYGIYLLHGIALYVLMTNIAIPPANGAEWWNWLYLPALSIVVVLFTAAAHRVVELPGIALGRRIGQWYGNTLSHVRSGAPATVRPQADA